MKRLAVLALLGTGCLLAGIVPGLAKKKETKPVIESFEATATGIGVVKFEIEEFSTTEEVQQVAHAYAKGGEDAVDSVLGKVEKGRTWVRSDAHPIRMVWSTSEGGVRTLNIVAVAADRVMGDIGMGGQMFIGHRGYPFTFVQFQIDQQGTGKGQEVPFAAIVFDKQGRISVKPMGAGIPLANVHAVSH